MTKPSPQPVLTRTQALKARPAPLPSVRTEEVSEGGLRVVVRVKRSKWQRWFGAPAQYNRKYVLDRMGREVYEACDGKTTVKAIVRRFAETRSLFLNSTRSAFSWPGPPFSPGATIPRSTRRLLTLV